MSYFQWRDGTLHEYPQLSNFCLQTAVQGYAVPNLSSNQPYYTYYLVNDVWVAGSYTFPSGNGTLSNPCVDTNTGRDDVVYTAATGYPASPYQSATIFTEVVFACVAVFALLWWLVSPAFWPRRR